MSRLSTHENLADKEISQMITLKLQNPIFKTIFAPTPRNRSKSPTNCYYTDASIHGLFLSKHGHGRYRQHLQEKEI
jgi:hypothetical protein